jgi:hypothetical protein
MLVRMLGEKKSSYTVGGNINLWDKYGNQYGDSSKS